MTRYVYCVITICGLLLACAYWPAHARTTRAASPSPGAWTFEVAPFSLWLPALDGNATVRGREADVDVSISEFTETLIDHLKFAAVSRFEAHRHDLILTLDLVYLDLQEDDATGPLGGDIKLEYSQLSLEFGAGYRLGTWPLGAASHPQVSLDILGGGRYVRLGADLEITGGGPLGADLEVDKDVDWIEPFIGARFRLMLSKSLSLAIRGDAGGFGIGSDMTWALVNTLQIQLSRRSVLLLGYRILDIDYEQGSGTTRFVYDIMMHGPTVGVMYRF